MKTLALILALALLAVIAHEVYRIRLLSSAWHAQTIGASAPPPRCPVIR